MESNKKKSVYDQEYAKQKLIQISFKLNRDLDADLIAWMDLQQNKQGYLKQLVRQDMERNQQA